MALAPKDVFDMGGAMGSMSTTVYLGALVPFTLETTVHVVFWCGPCSFGRGFEHEPMLFEMQS